MWPLDHMKKDVEFRFIINEKLYKKFKTLRNQRNLSTDDFLHNLLSVVKPPFEYQTKYELNDKEGKMIHFSQRVSKDVFLKFRILSAYFPTHEGTLDYLIDNEIKKWDCGIEEEF